MSLNILKIIGIPDDNKAVIIQNDGLFRQFALFFDGNSSFLEDTVIPNTTVTTLHLGGVEQLQNIKLPFKPDIVFNAICDPEIHNRSLALLDDMKFKDTLPMLNTTEGIRKTKRDELSQQLPPFKDFIIPKTYRIKPHSKTDIINSAKKYFDGKAFLFRPVSSHGGTGLIRIDDYHLADFDNYPLDGKEYFISEFIDFKSSDGLYRKARFFVIDGAIYPRHFVISQEWKVHASSNSILLDKNSLIEEESKFIVTPPVVLKKLCRHIHKYLKLDFFGVDCALMPDGQAVLFEANVCMRPFSPISSPHLHDARTAIQTAFINFIFNKALKCQ